MTQTVRQPNHALTLLGRVPSKKNGKRRMRFGKRTFMVPSAAHDSWHEVQMVVLSALWPKKLVLSEVEAVHLMFYAPDKLRADLSNKAESVMDLLVDAGVLADDNWFVVPKLILTMEEVDKANPRVVIHFYLWTGKSSEATNVRTAEKPSNSTTAR